MRFAGLVPALLFLATCAQAQPETAPSASGSTMTAIGSFGQPLSIDKGPWVVGEVLFFSGPKLVANVAWRDKVRAQRGALYTKSDLLADVDSLNTLGQFEKIEPALYEIPDSPIPPEFFSIASSTSQVRLVFNVVEKLVITPLAEQPKSKIPPAAISGIILTPTAYRGAGKYSTPGLGLDFNAVYFIGRLYGKNSFANSVRKSSYIDRLGVWLVTMDGKMQVQSEAKLRPAVAVGGQGIFMLRDSAQPSITTPNISVQVSAKSTQLLSDAYVVASKNFYGVRSSVGFMQGNVGNAVSALSEYLTPQALQFYANKPGGVVISHSIPFASLLLLPKPEYPLAVEVMKFNGAALNPILINFKLGYFFHLNFDISYLKFDNGYDVLGTFQFRFNQFPRR